MTIPQNYRCFSSLTVEISGFSLQQQLKQCLLTRLADFDGFPRSSCELSPDIISLSRLPHLKGIVYRSAIAFSLARQWSITPLTLAEGIFNHLKSIGTTPLSTEPVLGEVILKLVDPGWLVFELSDRSLGIWLQTFPHCPWPSQPSATISRNHNNLFPLEYVHARCCALLRLAEQEGMIQVKNGKCEQNFGGFKRPNPIPWYNPELEQLTTSHPVERSLISQMILTSDRLVNESTVDEIKLANHLSQAFLTFERHCRIFGEIAQNHRELSQARLGLVFLTQYLLRGLWLSQIPYPPRCEL